MNNSNQPFFSSNHRRLENSGSLEAGTQVVRVARKGGSRDDDSAMTMVSNQSNNLTHFCLTISKTAGECATDLKTIPSGILFLSLGFKRKQSQVLKLSKIWRDRGKEITTLIHFEMLLRFGGTFYFLHFA